MNEQSDPNSHPPERAQKRRGLKIAARILFYLTAGGLSICLAAYLLLQTDFGQTRVKALLISTAERNLGAQVRIGSISGNLFFGLSFEQVRISQDNVSLLTAKRIRINYLLPLLLAKTVFINEIQIDAPDLHLNKHPDGTWNIEALIPAGKEKSQPGTAAASLRIVVNRIGITDGNLVVTDARQQTEPVRHVNNIRMVAGLELTPDASIGTRILDFSLHSSQPDITLTSLTGRLDYHPRSQHLDLSAVHIRTAESDLTLNGMLDLSSPLPNLDLRTTIGALSLVEIGRIFSVPIFYTGNPHGDVFRQRSAGAFFA